MAASDNRAPRTYRKPGFIPDGCVDALGALSIVGKALFGDKWTGEEIADRPEDEARQRRDQAVQWLRQSAHAGTISPKIITKGGTDHLLPKHVWAADTARQIFDSGWAGFADDAGYEPVMLEGHVLFCEQELRRAFRHTLRAAEEGDEIPLYRSPFVDLLLRAERHFGEHIRQKKAEDIQDWLMVEGPKIDPRWSKSKAIHMATFLRHPDQQQGGAKRSRKGSRP